MMRKSFWLGLLLVATLGLYACETYGKTGAAIGAPVGALVGAGTGAIIGHQSDHAGEGAVIGGLLGAAAGGAGGYGIGKAVENRRSVVINVPNSNGSYTRVKLTRYGNEWVGPRGERYAYVPSPEQLASGGYGF